MRHPIRTYRFEAFKADGTRVLWIRNYRLPLNSAHKHMAKILSRFCDWESCETTLADLQDPDRPVDRLTFG